MANPSAFIGLLKTPHALWGAIALLLMAGVGITGMEYAAVGKSETLRANASGQRAVVDAISGAVSLGKPQSSASESTAFDVSAAPTSASEKTSDTPQEASATAAEPNAADTKEPTKDSASHTEEKAAEKAEAASETHAEKNTEPATAEPSAAQTPEHPSASAPSLQVPQTEPQTLRTAPLAIPKPPTENAKAALVPAPAPEISEKHDGHTLPKRGEGDTLPALIYARPFARTAEQKLLTVVVLDVGLSQQSLPLVMQLPREVTLAFSPYTKDVQSKIDLMRKRGYEVWSMLPTIGTGYPKDDPGPLGIVPSLPKEEQLRRLHQVLGNTLGSVGVVLPQEETLSTKPAVLSPLLAELDARGLRSFSAHRAEDAAYDRKLRRAHLFLDGTTDTATMMAGLNGLAKQFETADSQIVVASAHPQTLLLLAQWFAHKPFQKPVTLAPLSAHWQPKAGRPAPEPAAEKGHGGGHGDAKKEEKPKSSGGHH